jgi:hypothetical protein
MKTQKFNYAHPHSVWTQFQVVAETKERADQILDHFVSGSKSKTYDCVPVEDDRNLPESFQDMLAAQSWPVKYGMSWHGQRFPEKTVYIKSALTTP